MKKLMCIMSVSYTHLAVCCKLRPHSVTEEFGLAFCRRHKHIRSFQRVASPLLAGRSTYRSSDGGVVDFRGLKIRDTPLRVYVLKMLLDVNGLGIKALLSGGISGSLPSAIKLDVGELLEEGPIWDCSPPPYLCADPWHLGATPGDPHHQA